jgi:hypothetical protein
MELEEDQISLFNYTRVGTKSLKVILSIMTSLATGPTIEIPWVSTDDVVKRRLTAIGKMKTNPILSPIAETTIILWLKDIKTIVAAIDQKTGTADEVRVFAMKEMVKLNVALPKYGTKIPSATEIIVIDDILDKIIGSSR